MTVAWHKCSLLYRAVGRNKICDLDYRCSAGVTHHIKYVYMYVCDYRIIYHLPLCTLGNCSSIALNTISMLTISKFISLASTSFLNFKVNSQLPTMLYMIHNLFFLVRTLLQVHKPFTRHTNTPSHIAASTQFTWLLAPFTQF